MKQKQKQTSETYDYLQQVRDKGYAIHRKEIQIRELKSCLTRSAALQPNSDKIKSSPTNRLEDIESKIDSLEREVDELRQANAGLIIEVSDAIESLNDEIEKTVLFDFFVGRMKMLDIADEVGYSRTYTYDIKSRGISHLHILLKTQDKKDK